MKRVVRLSVCIHLRKRKKEEEHVGEKENEEGKVQKRKEKEDVQRKREDVQRKREEEDNYYYINNINYQYKYDLAYK